MAVPYTILFVDDDDAVRQSTAQVLAAKGFRTLVAHNGYEAMRLLAQEHVDLLFTDVVMPELDGIELAKQAKLLKPDLKVLFMTGYYWRTADAVQLGDLLFKPIRGDEIEAEISGLLPLQTAG